MAMKFISITPGQRVPNASTFQTKVDTLFADSLFVVLTVTGAALTGFTIAARPTPSQLASVTLYSTAADYTSPTGLLVGTSGDLTTQAVGTGWFIMDVSSTYNVELYAQSAGSAILSLEVGYA